jgi:hypothetical protein
VGQYENIMYNMGSEKDKIFANGDKDVKEVIKRVE